MVKNLAHDTDLFDDATACLCAELGGKLRMDPGNRGPDLLGCRSRYDNGQKKREGHNDPRLLENLSQDVRAAAVQAAVNEKEVWNLYPGATISSMAGAAMPGPKTTQACTQHQTRRRLALASFSHSAGILATSLP